MYGFGNISSAKLKSSRSVLVSLEFDGANSGNPGRSAAGAVLRDGNQ
ncbi:hypothetical protein L195_g060700, partial [Trifolium pratense]